MELKAQKKGVVPGHHYVGHCPESGYYVCCPKVSVILSSDDQNIIAHELTKVEAETLANELNAAE